MNVIIPYIIDIKKLQNWSNTEDCCVCYDIDDIFIGDFVAYLNHAFMFTRDILNVSVTISLYFNLIENCEF